jgi:hypothetical protein
VDKIVAAHLKGQASADLPFRKIVIQRKVEDLRVENSENPNRETNHVR